MHIDEAGLPHSTGLSEEEAHHVLARAVELDAYGKNDWAKRADCLSNPL
jgi:hypothetical protein